MNFSLVQRKHIQETIEEALLELNDCGHKQLFLIILALIQDLAETEEEVRPHGLEKQNITRWYIKEIQTAVEEFKKIAFTEAEGISMQHFTILAENMRLMSDSLFELRDHLFIMGKNSLKNGLLQ